MQYIKEKELQNKIYKKHNSFFSFEKKNYTTNKSIIDKILDTKKNDNVYNLLSSSHKKILDDAIKDLLLDQPKEENFRLTENVISEIENIESKDILKYIVNRYRYEIFPKKKIIDEFPPCLQIEPSSVCNYRCVFCFETDKTFTNKKSGFMGEMSLGIFKEIIDQIVGKVEFVTLASRGEPLVSKSINEMLLYTKNKFLNLKINTNASLLDEKKCHSILEGGVKTIVFSADAADPELYKKIRVNGNLEKVLKNIELFNNIRQKHYSKQKIISRVSGVKFTKEQNFDSMISLWRDLVDQVAFVEYNPWENTYLRPDNDIKTPCSDLWRRMFVWWDGKANPCDVDYKSHLTVGSFKKRTITNLWNSKEYENLRENHKNNKRKNHSPCKACTVI
jgi:radical SAM protein with 4Fe4S-binding SPASM domain